MIKILLDLVAMGPAVAQAVTEGIASIEAATDTETRVKAALTALEALADAIRRNI